MIVLTFTLPNINASVQAGDLMYYTPQSVLSGAGGITSSNNAALLVGTIWDHTLTTVSVLYDDNNNINPQPVAGDYLFFGKSAVVNNTRLRGYYMEVLLANDSKESAELYSLSSDIEESSK